jgi:hypothetical protein
MADGIPQGWKQVTDPNQLNQDMTERPVPGLYKATVPGIKDGNGRSTRLPVVTNSSNGNFQVYEPTLFGDKLIYSYNASNDKTTINDNEKYKTYFSGEEGKKQYDTLNKTVKTRTLEISEKNAKGDGGGVSPEVAKKQLEDLKKSEGYKSTTSTPQAKDPNKPTEGQLSKDDIDTIKDAAGKEYEGRKKYPGGDLRYPINMNSNQDCIQFKIIKYVARGLGLDKNLGLRKDAPPAGNILATITLPMPSGGITDRNSVNWQSGELNPAAEGVAAALNSFLLGGAEAGAETAKDQFGAVFGDKSDTKLLTALIASKTIQSALGQNVLSRQYGVVINPNLELLFDSPSLRDFSFTFKMTPRSKSEAIRVRTIIRYFKQSMSVKRSKSVLLLKAPHTFRIQYKTSNQDHPYLNRFKECALTNCSVNYTPDGQYMSYDDSDPDGRSMTAYELSLSFQELEPIFDDDYDDKDALPTNIGY